MTEPDSLLTHARRLADPARPPTDDVDLRRATSAAYYAVFHDLTDRAARHLIGSATDGDRNRIRRVWTHGEIAVVAQLAVDRANTLAENPTAPLPRAAGFGGPLVDLTASDPDLVETLRLFIELRNEREQADYDHDAHFARGAVSSTCDDASRAREGLRRANPASREAFFTLLTVRRPDFQDR